MHLDTLEKLYAHQLKDLWSAENQIVDALEKHQARVESDDLKKAMSEHLELTRRHVDRLEKIFENLDFGPQGHRCDGMAGLLKEGDEIWSSEGAQEVLEAAMIAALQRVEHYEMAGYGTARAYAQKLGYTDQAEVLTKTLEEEGHADRALTQLAERAINFKAMVAGQ